ncbi:MAG: dihydrofolate reductase [Burkholderiales bacterium]|nr:dihydrofolate reductase [Burkholderiales bacterium]
MSGVGAARSRGTSGEGAHHPPRLSVIAAVSRNGVIGANGAIPWHLPDELKLFRSITMGHHIIMGRKTWESIGRLLPGRSTVIVSRQPGYRVAGATVARSLGEAISACANDPEPFVIGGAELYRAALPLADRLYLTTVEADIGGDAMMPEFDPGEWREVSCLRHGADERHAHPYRQAVHERIR